MIIKISPISVNRCWQGRRFKTKEYKDFEEEALWKLKNCKDRHTGFVFVVVNFYVKNFLMADENNYLKPFFDILTKSKIIKDDRFVIGHTSKKIKVNNKEDEHIEFFIEEINQNTNDNRKLPKTKTPKTKRIFRNRKRCN